MGAMAVNLARVGKTHIGLVAAAVVLAVAWPIGDPLSLVLGGAVMGANLWLLRVITDAMVRRSAADDGGRGVGLAIGAIVLKFGLFLGLVAALLARLPIEGMSFVVGVTLLLAACVVEAVRNGAVPVKGES